MSENGVFVGQTRDEWLGSGAVRRGNVEICGLWKRLPFACRFEIKS
ncbi:hypothetical protein ACFL9T_07505 [Thermodesulfobacteriota bacterium]